MSRILFILSFFVMTSNISQAQTIWTDTVRTFVKLGQYDLGEKIVQADYGRVIMFFRQSDYLEKETNKDTVQTSPRYFKDHNITELLKEGKAKVIRRSTNSEVYEINHRLVQYGSMCNREFEFSDGVGFWRYLEIVGIYGAIVSKEPDSTELDRRSNIIPKKEFDPDLEEFPDLTQKISFRISDYFPEKKHITFVYKPDVGMYGYLDTIGFKRSKIENQEVFYFPFLGYSKYNLKSVGTTMFGDGAYFYRNDSLYTVEVDYEKDIIEKSLGNSRLLFPAEMSIGDSVSIDYGFKKKILTYINNETVNVGSLSYTDCVKIKVLTYWPETVYLSYIWLKKDLGMVKWMRNTGRIDELVNRY